MSRAFTAEVEWRSPDTVTPYGQNAKTHATAQIDKIAASIAEFGFDQPIVVDADGVIIKGHGRREAALRLGLAKLPVIVRTDLTEAQIKAARIADNKTAESPWDDDLLRIELGGLRDAGFDLGLTGFADDELAGLFADANAGLTDPDDVPEPPAAPITRTGDVWIMGRHRLVCGDATSEVDVSMALAGVRPHLMVTDPPYGVDYEPEWRVIGKREGKLQQRGGGGKNSVGLVTNDGRIDWSEAWMLSPSDVAYVWSAPGPAQMASFDALIVGAFSIRQQIIWVKEHFAISRGHYHYQHEPCWYAVRDGKTAHWAGARDQATIWKIPGNNGFRKESAATGHSTQKPVECMKRPIENNSSPGQAVYDPFVGSGTTIIAAEMTGRACHAIEISPQYCDVAVLRWQAFTGQIATSPEGVPFGTMAEIPA